MTFQVHVIGEYSLVKLVKLYLTSEKKERIFLILKTLHEIWYDWKRQNLLIRICHMLNLSCMGL